MRILRILEITANSWARESVLSGVLCAACAVSQPRQAIGRWAPGRHRPTAKGTYPSGNLGRGEKAKRAGMTEQTP